MGVAEPRGLILMYHRVARLACDPFGLAVRPPTFRAQIGELRANWRPMPLAALLEGARGGRLPPRAVALTFDDGYVDALSAADVLCDEGVPATFFVNTGPFEETGEFWWDRLEGLLLGAEPLPATLCLAGLPTLPTATAAERWCAFEAAHATLLGASAAERGELLAALQAWSGRPRHDRESHRALRPSEVQQLDGRPGVAVAAHGVQHLPLPSQAPEARRAEIEGSKARLEELLGRPIVAFAYPFGMLDDGAVGAVREAGFAMAVTTEPGTVSPSCDPLRLPRLPVGEWATADLARRMRAVLGSAEEGGR